MLTKAPIATCEIERTYERTYERTCEPARSGAAWHPRAVPMAPRPNAALPLPEQPTIDVVDESFIRVERAVLAREVARRWTTWWPGLHLQIYMDRGIEGMRWTVAGEMVGSSEIWLEEHAPGVIVHYYLRAEPTVPGSATTPRPLDGTRRARARVAAMRQRHVLAWKQVVWSMKDELEADAHPYRQ